MIEAFALGVLENFLGNYIADIIAQRRSARTRTEVIDEIKAEIKQIARVQEQVDALAITVRELDEVVHRDPSLRWRDERLVLEPPRRFAMSRPSAIDPKIAIAQLHESITKRRQELEQIEGARLELAPEAPAPAKLIDTPGSEVGDIRRPLGPWGRRVIELESEVRDARRGRTEEGKQ